MTGPERRTYIWRLLEPTMRTNAILPAIILLALCSCDTATPPAAIPTAAKSDPRDALFMPDSVFAVVGGVGGRTVVDLFAGDGYFTFKMLGAGANVIAMDTDPSTLEEIRARAKELGIGDDRLKVRTLDVNAPELAAEEADMALMVDRFARIPHVTAFIERVRAGLRKPKRVIIIDHHRDSAPADVPVHERLTEVQVMDSMDVIHISDVGAYSKKLPGRFVVIAQDLELSDEELQEMMRQQQGTAPAQ